MILLVSGATTAIEKYKHKKLGQLLTPATGNNVERIIKNGLPWACDNGCFTGFDEIAYLRMVKKVQGKPGLVFVTMPDVVGNSKATRELFELWYPIFKKYYDVPLAYVLQNGVSENEIPWDKIAAVFVGGDTEWKLGEEAARLVKAAKEKCKWVHMGRVNSFRRLDYAIQIGCDSADGSKYSMFPNAHIPKALEHLKREQISLEGVYE
jgi:hypothetical protein